MDGMDLPGVGHDPPVPRKVILKREAMHLHLIIFFKLVETLDSIITQGKKKMSKQLCPEIALQNLSCKFVSEK